MTIKTLLTVLLFAVALLTAHQAHAVCGDVTGDGMVSSSDALSVLRAAVGDYHRMMCVPCGATTTSTTVDASTTTLGGSTTTTTITGDGRFTLRVSMHGMMYGSPGRVTSSPAGIDCGNDCTEAYDAGRVVTLTAVSDRYSDFVGWSGDVPNSCLYDDDPCTVTMDRDVDVWAMFRGGIHR